MNCSSRFRAMPMGSTVLPQLSHLFSVLTTLTEDSKEYQLSLEIMMAG